MPYWLDEEPQPARAAADQSVFWGMLRRQGDWIYPALWRVPRLRGLLVAPGHCSSASR